MLNNVKTLKRCIESIVSQSYPHKKLIVMDGGSTDGSIALLDSYRNKITYYESQPDRGIYHAWNKALKHSQGEWFCFLGADDYFWDKKVLSNLSPYLKQAQDASVRIVYGKVAKVDAVGNTLKLEGKPWKKIRWQMRHGMPLGLPHPGLMHHQTLFEEHGVFDESFKIAGDYEYLLRELKDNTAMYVDDIVTVGHEVAGLADKSKLAAQIEVAKARRKNGYNSVSWLWTIVFIRTLLLYLWHKLIQK